jgi:choline dehydrogenase
VVIGAGAAGCVIAGRLSQTMSDARIALIEAGGERLGLTTKVPGTAFIASSFARRNWNFETEPVPALNGRTLRWFQGRILGGSSSINGMLYLRGHSLEYDQWAQPWLSWVVVRASAALLQESRDQHPRSQRVAWR